MTATPRLGLPFLSAGQAQKEFFHNEALQTLDATVWASVEEAPRAAPPASPAIGVSYLVAASPTGAWAGKPQCLATYSVGGWRFVQPFEGLNVYVRADALWALYRSGSWEFGLVRASSLMIAGQQVVGARGAPISDPAGGTTVDSQARIALGQALAALRLHGLIGT